MNSQFIGFDLSEYPIINVTLNICFVVMTVCLICCAFRLVKGPSISDRIISGDAISCVVMVLVLLYGIMQTTNVFMPAVLVTALLGFIGMIGMSKFLAGGDVSYPLEDLALTEDQVRKSDPSTGVKSSPSDGAKEGGKA